MQNSINLNLKTTNGLNYFAPKNVLAPKFIDTSVHDNTGLGQG